MAKKDSKFPSVLAFEKKLVSSDGYLYGTTWEKRLEEVKPLGLCEKSVRGTISNRLSDKVLGDPMKISAEVEKPNLQTVDACALAPEHDTLKLTFTLKVLSGVETPSACNSEEFNKSYVEVAKNYIEQDGFRELAKRYAMNLANGRYLWRNRVGAEKIEVIVAARGKKWTFNGFEFQLKSFDVENEEVSELAQLIADALCGKLPYLLINVETFALVGKAQEVYPSEELILDKGKGAKSKILYAVNGIAAMHSQKIGNAIRTIDTWYPDYGEVNMPIAIEPYGAVTNLGKAFRTDKEAEFYALFDQYALGGKLKKKEQEHYVMAVLIRGGVFGQSSKG